MAAGVATGHFRTAAAIGAWIGTTFGVSARPGGLAHLVARAGGAQGTAPPPRAGRPGRAAVVEQGGLVTALTLADGSAGQAVGHLDEMRLGLVGARRRRWGIRSVQVIPPRHAGAGRVELPGAAGGR